MFRCVPVFLRDKEEDIKRVEGRKFSQWSLACQAVTLAGKSVTRSGSRNRSLGIVNQGSKFPVEGCFPEKRAENQNGQTYQVA